VSSHSGRRDREPCRDRRPAATSAASHRSPTTCSSGPRDDGPWFQACYSLHMGAARGRQNSSSWSPVSLAPAPAGRCWIELCISRASLIRFRHPRVMPR
jgi:hypothetical protein